MTDDKITLDRFKRGAVRAIAGLIAIKLEIGDAKSTNGKIKCPSCEKPLWFCVAPNGHIHARCETEDCTAFMQ